MHPGAWLAWILCAGLAVAVTTNPFYLLPLAAAAWVVYAGRRTEGPAARSFRIFLVIAAVTLVTRTSLVLVSSPVTAGSVAFAAAEGLRLAVLLILFGTFNAVTDPFRMLRLAPRRWHEPALATTLALSIAPRTIAAVSQVREAQRVRGLDTRGLRSLAALAVPVLETGMEEAVTLAESMDARGHGRGPRSRYRPEKWEAASLAVTVVAAASSALFVHAAVTGAGDPIVSTFPLRWPDVSLGLVGAAISFVVPAVVRPKLAP